MRSLFLRFFELTFPIRPFSVTMIEIPSPGGRDDEQRHRLARPGPILRAQQAAARDLAVPLDLPVCLLAVFPGDRPRGRANRPERRPLPDRRAGGQKVGATTPAASTGTGGPTARRAAPRPPRA